MDVPSLNDLHEWQTLHASPGIFVIPNPWDAGSAKILASLGFKALATTSAGLSFSLGKPAYGAHEIEEQKRAVYDSGYDGWVMWEPGSRYDKFLPALEKTFVSRKKNPPVPRPANRLD